MEVETIKLLMERTSGSNTLLPTIEVLPSKLYRYSEVMIIGFVGMPFSSKTSLTRFLKDRLSQVSNLDYVEIPDVTTTDEFLDTKHLGSRERLTLVDHAIQYFKVLRFFEGLSQVNKFFLKKVEERDEKKRILYVADRGLDILPWERAIFTEQYKDTLGEEVLDLEYIFRPFLHPDFDGGFIFLSVLSLLSLHFFDVIILCDNTLNRAMDFRETNGLPREGMVVNPTIWPILHRGYEWFFEHVVPWMMQHYGTGFKVVHADRPIPEIGEEVYQYLEKVIFGTRF